MAKIQYKFLGLPEGDAKQPNQAVIILKTLKELGGEDNKFIDRDDLVAELDKVDGDRPNKLNARQPVERVVAFYQKRLVDANLIEMNKEAAAPKEKKEKPAKSASGEITGTGKSKVPGSGPKETPDETAESVAI